MTAPDLIHKNKCLFPLPGWWFWTWKHKKNTLISSRKQSEVWEYNLRENREENQTALAKPEEEASCHVAEHERLESQGLRRTPRQDSWCLQPGALCYQVQSLERNGREKEGRRGLESKGRDGGRAGGRERKGNWRKRSRRLQVPLILLKRNQLKRKKVAGMVKTGAGWPTEI